MKFAILLSALLLAACASTAPKAACTPDKILAMTTKLEEWATEESGRMTASLKNASLQEIQAGKERLQSLIDRTQKLKDLAEANEVEGLCRELRHFAADYNFSVE